ncbi:hypothetical protein bpSLO_001486 (plasmid) [Borrelia parkeri]|uniref:Vsp/OspC family lipoprotein n=1 Tax=Borrelia parkeri TaxID=141 RepID=UPI001FF12EDC|nr:hypothetical protein bpSLO_001486 [Borrelia parkeri]
MKRITFCALLMTLFLLISCNNSASSPKDGQAAKSDGTLIDLATISSKITEAVAFAKDVKEVHTLVKSIDELAKAIGKKIKSDGQFDTESGKNGSLLAGAQSIMLAVKAKLGHLENKEGFSTELKQKITDSKTKTETFLTKLKDNHSDLGKNEATDDDTKKAIKKDNDDKTKGAEELIKLNTAIDALFTAAEDAVTAAITQLSTPAKSASSAKSN